MLPSNGRETHIKVISLLRQRKISVWLQDRKRRKATTKLQKERLTNDVRYQE
jgi:hypothetical protein